MVKEIGNKPGLWLKVSKPLTILFIVYVLIMAIISGYICSKPLSTPIDSNLANSFLATIAQVSASILAIVFSVSILAIEIVSDRYSTRLYSYFIKDKATIITFFSHLICISISLIAIGDNTFPMFQWGFLAMILLFMFCIFTLSVYFIQTLSLLNPKNLADRIKNEAVNRIVKCDWDSAQEDITSLGDITLKAFKRDEEDVTRKCLVLLHEILRGLFNNDKSSNNAFDKKSIELPQQFSCIQIPIIAQYYRIYKIAIDDKNYEITQMVAHFLSGAIVMILKTDNSGLIKRSLHQYEDFFQITLETDDFSREILIQTLRDIIFPFYGIGISDENLSIGLGLLIQINKIIIDHDGFEVWRLVLNYFSKLPSIEYAYDSFYSKIREFLKSLNDIGIEISNEKFQFWLGVFTVMSNRITRTNYDLTVQILLEIEKYIPPSDEKINRIRKETRELLDKLYRLTTIYDAFFYICIHALFRKKNNFIKELWQHTNPLDADAIWGNPNMIYLNLGFLTNQMMAHTIYPFEILQYHGIKKYALKYYLLCISYALNKKTSDWVPSTYPFMKSDLLLDNDFSRALTQDIRAQYYLLKNFSFTAKQVLSQADEIKFNNKEWNDIFDGNIIHSLDKASVWLSNTQEWENEADNIITEVPLDDVKIEGYRKLSLDYYYSNRLIEDVVIFDTSSGKNPTELIESCNYQCPDKIEFTKIGISESTEIGLRYGYEAIGNIIRSEVDFIIQRLQKQKGIKKQKIKQLTYTYIQKAAKQITNVGFDADVIIVDGFQFSNSYRNDISIRENIEYIENKRFIKLSSTLKLRIIEIKCNTMVYLLSKKAGKWITSRPLTVSIQECDKNPLKVESIARETVDYQIEYAKAVQILEIKT
jgi:hypothetical protein